MIAPDLSISTPLVEFFENVYKPRRVESSRNWICVVKRSIRILADMLGRVPVVGDLTPDTVKSLRARLDDSEQDWRNHSRHAKAIRSMMYMAQSILADLRPNPNNLPTPMPGMLLSEFVDAYYTSQCRAVLSKSWRWHLHRGAESLSDMLGRPAVVSDLCEQTFARLVEWLKTAANGKQLARKNVVRALWASAALYGLVEPRPERPRFPRSPSAGRKTAFPLTTEPGTLWELCQGRYFRTNLRIRHANTKGQYRMALSFFGEFLGRQPMLTDLDDQSAALPRTNGKAGAA
jgi:hypothetical protein